MKRTIVIFGFFVLTILAIVSAYTPPAYNNIDITLGSGYSAPSYTNVELTLSENTTTTDPCLPPTTGHWYVPSGCVITTQQIIDHLPKGDIICQDCIISS